MDQKTLSALEKIVRNALKEILKTDAPVTVEDVFVGVGNRKKTASKEWQKGCLYHLAGIRLLERNGNTFSVKQKSAIRQYINEYPLTQEVVICGTAIAASNFKKKYALSIFQRMNDEQYNQFEQAHAAIRLLFHSEERGPKTRDELFPNKAQWQSAFLKRLVATGCCSAKGQTRWVKYRKSTRPPDNEKLVELLFPKWYRYVQRVTSPGFLEIEKHPKEVKLEHVVSDHPESEFKSESVSGETNVGLMILEKLVQYLQILEYQSTRLDKIEAQLQKLNSDVSTPKLNYDPRIPLSNYVGFNQNEVIKQAVVHLSKDKDIITIKDICKQLDLKINPRGVEAKQIANILREQGFKRTKVAIFDPKLNRKVQTRIFKK
jgi:hypothetical protein